MNELMTLNTAEISNKKLVTQFTRINKAIERYLKSKNIPTTSMGFIYLIDAIEMVIKDKTLAYHIVRDVYTPIGKKYGKSKESVERAIRYCITKVDKPTSNAEFIIDSAIVIKNNRNKEKR